MTLIRHEEAVAEEEEILEAGREWAAFFAEARRLAALARARQQKPGEPPSRIAKRS